MAESVDALVSNTSGAIRAGSTPAPGTDNEAEAAHPGRPRFIVISCFGFADVKGMHYICQDIYLDITLWHS